MEVRETAVLTPDPVPDPASWGRGIAPAKTDPPCSGGLAGSSRRHGALEDMPFQAQDALKETFALDFAVAKLDVELIAAVR